jgi:hypothetical protein
MIGIGFGGGAAPGDSIVGAVPSSGPRGGATGAPHTMHAVAPSKSGRLHTAQFIGCQTYPRGHGSASAIFGTPASPLLRYA